MSKLDVKQLYHVCDETQLGFKTTRELEDLSEFLGQERALDALDFGVGIQRKGFNIFVQGSSGTGRHTVVFRFLRKIAKTQSAPQDLCYVHNFDEDDQPKVLILPTGKAKLLKQDIKDLVQDLQVGIPAAFEEDDYRKRKAAVEEKFNAHRRDIFKKLDEEANAQNVAFMETQAGFVFAPKKDGKVVSAEDFESFPKEEKEIYEAAIEALQKKLKDILHEMPRHRRELREETKKLNEETIEFAVAHLFDELRSKYKELDGVLAYLTDVKKHVADHIDIFWPKDSDQSEEPNEDDEEASLRIYDVNVLVDASPCEGAPVVYESHPTYPNLVGRIELKPKMGGYTTDFHYIKAGALHRANGGYLVLDAHKLLMQPLGWESLKRIIRTQEIRIESLNQVYNMATTITLQPETVPLDCKVILIGDRRTYYMLSQLDPEFSELFKVAVDFEDQIDANGENISQYSRLLATMAKKEEMLPLDASAVARVIEHSHRLVDDHRRLSANILNVADILREADFWAKREKKELITKADIEQTIAFQVKRVSRVRDRIYEDIVDGTKLIDTEGSRVGQINGLSVLSLGNFAFGQPARITVTTRLGNGNVIDVEREAELGGSIHSKGVLIISQFIGHRYSRNLPLSLAASIVFEQSYGMIDGDSASTAELCALLSSLSEVPIRQSLAVTGSINQYGQVQAIGGVNEKIEGFFDICRDKGLADGQGVVIPDANVRNLMLRKDVIEAVEAGQFAIYAVKTLDEALEILTGEKAGKLTAKGFEKGTINQKVLERLEELSKLRLKYIGARDL